MKNSITHRFGGLFIAAVLASPAVAQFQLPSGSSNEVGFVGSASDAGVSGYQGPNPATTGHSLISQNSSGVAYYYVAGRSDGPSPAGTPPTIPNAATASSVTGFSLFQSALGTQGKTISDVTLHFGPTDSIFENSWNLGSDRNGLNSSTGAALNGAGVLGVDHEYEAWSGSTIEDRFYSANSSEVTYYLSVEGVRIVDIDYADLFMRIDYGATSSGIDDTIQAYHAVAGVSITDGLVGPEYLFADAFINDVNNAGGGLQVLIDTVQPAVTGTYSYNGQFGSHFDINGRLVATTGSAVPEPGTYATWCAAFALGFAGCRRRRAAYQATSEEY